MGGAHGFSLLELMIAVALMAILSSIGVLSQQAMLPGVNGMATRMMKNLIKKKGVASIADLRAAAVESEIEMIGCQMTMDLFEFKKKDMIPGIKIGGAATYMENALKSDINLFI